jgi:hypothetical protein
MPEMREAPHVATGGVHNLDEIQRARVAERARKLDQMSSAERVIDVPLHHLTPAQSARVFAQMSSADLATQRSVK